MSLIMLLLYRYFHARIATDYPEAIMRKPEPSRPLVLLEAEARESMRKRYDEFRTELEKTMNCGQILQSIGMYTTDELLENCLLARRVALAVQTLTDRVPLDDFEGRAFQYLSTSLEHYKNERERLTGA